MKRYLLSVQTKDERKIEVIARFPYETRPTFGDMRKLLRDRAKDYGISEDDIDWPTAMAWV